MTCPKCQYECAVIDSRDGPDNTIRRRRRCLKCPHRWTTYESNISPEMLASLHEKAHRMLVAAHDLTKGFEGPTHAP
jgi:transcriptional regulator NrdR family protein